MFSKCSFQEVAIFPWVVSVPTEYEHFTLISLIFVFKEIYFPYKMVAKTQQTTSLVPTLKTMLF